MPVATSFVTDAQRRSYRDNGYFITGVIFDPPTLAGLRAEFQRIWDAAIAASAGAEPIAQQLVRERPFLADLTLQSEVCRAFFRHPSMVALMADMLGPDVDLGYNQTVIKPPTGVRPNSFAWHQDSYYACRGHGRANWDETIMTDATRTFQSWVAVTPTTVANGTLVVLPGRHREGFFPAERSEETGEFVADLDTAGATPVELAPGQMLAFSGMLPHSSGANTTPDQTRMVYQFSLCQPGGRKGPSAIPVLRGGRAT